MQAELHTENRFLQKNLTLIDKCKFFSLFKQQSGGIYQVPGISSRINGTKQKMKFSGGSHHIKREIRFIEIRQEQFDST